MLCRGYSAKPPVGIVGSTIAKTEPFFRRSSVMRNVESALFVMVAITSLERPTRTFPALIGFGLIETFGATQKTLS
ncbi:hypothetical protein HRbin20_01419 [bacterium HR20]|nr:hypothetical protein HRbin20_01419 [bacterium HR20]